MIIPIDHKFDLMYSKLASREHQWSRQADFKDHQDFNDVVKFLIGVHRGCGHQSVDGSNACISADVSEAECLKAMRGLALPQGQAQGRRN